MTVFVEKLLLLLLKYRARAIDACALRRALLSVVIVSLFLFLRIGRSFGLVGLVSGFGWEISILLFCAFFVLFLSLIVNTIFGTFKSTLGFFRVNFLGAKRYEIYLSLNIQSKK